MVEKNQYRPILLFTVGTKDRNSADIENVRKAISENASNSSEFISIVVSNSEMSEMDIKCINPVLLTDEEYKETFELVNRLKKIEFNNLNG